MAEGRSAWVKFTILFASTMTVMAGAIVAPSLPTLRAHFSGMANVELLSRLVLTLPALFIALGSPLVGWLIDKTGRKRLLVVALIFYAITGTSGIYLDNLIPILVGRALLGLSVAGIMTTCTTLIADYFGGEERNKFLGYQASAMAAGGIVYISLGGFLADFSWRGPFFVYVLALVIVPLAIYFLPELASRHHTSHKREGEKEEEIPYLPVISLYGVMFLGMIFFYMVPVQAPFLLNSNTPVSNSLVGLAIATATLSASFTSLNFNWLKRFFSADLIYALAFGFMSVGYLVLASGNMYWQFTTGLFISGFGTGLVIPNSNLKIIDFAPDAYKGRLLGGLSTCLFLGQFTSPIAIQPLVDYWGLQTAFFVAALSVLVMGTAFFVKHKAQINKLREMKKAEA